MTVLVNQQSGGNVKYQKTPVGKVPDGIEPRVRIVRFKVDLVVVETITNEKQPTASLAESDESINTDKIVKRFDEYAKNIVVTTESSIAANEAT